MTGIEIYKARVLARGNSIKERIENSLKRDFEDVLRRSPNRVDFEYNDETYEGLLVQLSKTQSELKTVFNFFTRVDLQLPEGGVISIFDKVFNKTRKWVIFNAEPKSYYGYIKYKVLELNYELKYITDYGVEKVMPAFITGSADSEIKDYFKIVFSSLVELPNKTLSLVIPATKDLNSNCRFMIGEEVWRYIDSDKISIPGVYYATFFETQRDEYKDSIEDQLADIDKINNTKIISNYGEDEIITVGVNTKNLQFEVKKEGKLINSSIEILFEEEYEGATIEKDIISFTEPGTYNIIVKDKISGFSQYKTIEVKPTYENYFFVLGDDSIPELESRLYTINTDQPYTFDYDKTFISVKTHDGGLEIQGLKKGDVIINFHANENEYSLKIKVCSIWM